MKIEWNRMLHGCVGAVVAAIIVAIIGPLLLRWVTTLNIGNIPTAPSSTTPVSAQSTFVNCNNVPTDTTGVAAALSVDQSLVGSPLASCSGGKPGGWVIDPNHTGMTATLHPGMCVDFDGRSTNFSNENALGWTEPSNWHNVTPVRTYIIQDTTVTSEGLTVYWSPCQRVQP